ncbi:hypothetical protein F2P81_007475 [Scophthalmus maximus]|uniref:ribonuclease H n=1 Tax=Scophthalmus maximus TaxID=52904 RepID=A0A6A4T5G0_SCOMX|nr:hypothetical protein F2P81_007475 [Scophthalmus maximus]
MLNDSQTVRLQLRHEIEKINDDLEVMNLKQLDMEDADKRREEKRIREKEEECQQLQRTYEIQEKGMGRLQKEFRKARTGKAKMIKGGRKSKNEGHSTPDSRVETVVIRGTMTHDDTDYDPDETESDKSDNDNMGEVGTEDVYRPQYQNKPAAVAGLRDTIDGLLKSGVIEKSDSCWHTPLLPGPKANGLTYRMAHDLRAVNDVVRTPVVPVPNPFTALSVLNSQHSWFTVIDLANAFFCIPLANHLRHPFAFTYAGQKYQYTRLPQGFSLSPGIFNSVLREQLNKLSLPPGTVLVQYVDDILLA